MLPGKKLSIADLLQMIRRRIWLIVIPPMVTLLPALVYSSRIPNLYQSDMLIAIDPQRVPDAFVRSTVTLGAEARMDAISVQVRSRTNLQAMIEQFDLYPEERQLLPMEDVVQIMNDHIEVTLERSRDSSGRVVPNAFHVQFTHTDPNVSARVTQQLGSLFVEQNSRDRSSLAGATNAFLDTQLREARAKLEEQERRLEDFRQKHGKSLPTQMGGNLQALQSTQLQVQATVESIARDRDRRQMLERLFREAEAAPLAAEPPTVAAGTAAAAAPGINPNTSPRQQLAAARTLLASLELRYRPDHPDVIRTKTLIANLSAQVDKEAPDDASLQPRNASASTAELQRRERLAQMSAEIESLDRQIAFRTGEEKRLREEIAEYQRRIEAVPGLESQWVSLTRDYDTQQLAYKELLTKSGAARVAADLEEQQIGEHFRIVDSATVPVRPLPSNRFQLNVAGFAIGLFFGLGLAALLEWRDKSYRSDEDVLQVLSLPVLASVPYIETEGDVKRRRVRALLFSGAGVAFFVFAAYVTWTMQLWKSLT
jgi:polysaccharide chain length determinant protein (PEP-CTERM system associated)